MDKFTFVDGHPDTLEGRDGSLEHMAGRLGSFGFSEDRYEPVLVSYSGHLPFIMMANQMSKTEFFL